MSASIQLTIASPDDILAWSFGEVYRPETLNYRTLRPERGGLFCERIFGPTRDWECACGRYRRVRFQGLVCDRCGVEVTRARVRRERMGHIELAAPAAHPWFARAAMRVLLEYRPRDVEDIIYHIRPIVVRLDEEMLARIRAAMPADEPLREVLLDLRV